MRIYVASSWRNQLQQSVVARLRTEGHQVYDFKNPAPGSNGFHWSEIDPCYRNWNPEGFRRALGHVLAIDGFDRDMHALETCEACVLVLPCGRSAHLELGWASGAGRLTFVLMTAPDEPELMYKMSSRIVTSLDELVHELHGYDWPPAVGGVIPHPGREEA